MKPVLKNILLVSGTGQNTGKTSLVCKLITHFCTETTIIAIKTTHHLKTLSYELPIVTQKNDFIIYEEIEINKQKDSSKMLRAGAKKSFFIVSEKESIGIAIYELLQLLDKNIAIICESGGLADYYQPALHLHLKNNTNTNKPDRVCDCKIQYDGENFSINLNNIAFKNNTWKQIQR